jgi:Flp pilus assembly protein TadD
MPPLRRRSAPTAFALLLLGTGALGLAGCAADDGHRQSIKSLSDLRDKGGSMVKLGDASRVAGDCPAAIRFYSMVQDKDESHAETLAARMGAADCELSMNALPDAERDYRLAMGVAPQDPGPLIGLGRVYLVSHKPGEAAIYLDQALKKGADAAFVWNDKGVAYDQLRRHKEAQQAYRDGIARYPSDRALRNNLALSLAMSRQFPEAETLLRQLVAEPGATSRTRENLALVLGLEGNAADARQVAANDLDGAALDNNGRFYAYARALMTGETPPVTTASVAIEESAAPPPTQTARVDAAPIPPPVFVAQPTLRALRPAEPSTIEQSAELAKAEPTRPPRAETAKTETPAPAAIQTASLPPPAAPKAAAAKPETVAATGQPTRIVATDGSALKSTPATAAGPVASSE